MYRLPNSLCFSMNEDIVKRRNMAMNGDLFNGLAFLAALPFYVNMSRQSDHIDQGPWQIVYSFAFITVASCLPYTFNNKLACRNSDHYFSALCLSVATSRSKHDLRRTPLTNSCVCVCNRLPVVFFGTNHWLVPRTGSAFPRRPT
jgi:hypothetical protein